MVVVTVMHVLHRDSAPHANHKCFDLALVLATGDAEIAVLAPVLSPGVCSNLKKRKMGFYIMYTYKPKFQRKSQLNKCTKMDLPNISLLSHQSFSPLPTWYVKQTQLRKFSNTAKPENKYPVKHRWKIPCQGCAAILRAHIVMGKHDSKHFFNLRHTRCYGKKFIWLTAS